MSEEQLLSDLIAHGDPLCEACRRVFDDDSVRIVLLHTIYGRTLESVPVEHLSLLEILSSQAHCRNCAYLVAQNSALFDGYDSIRFQNVNESEILIQPNVKLWVIATRPFGWVEFCELQWFRAKNMHPISLNSRFTTVVSAKQSCFNYLVLP